MAVREFEEIELGRTARDTITGFEGVVVGRTEWLNGCVRVGLQPPVNKEGKVLDAYWVDVEQVEVLDIEPKAKLQPTNGPMPDPVR